MHEGLVKVAAFWPLDANIARSRLEADGITCIIHDEMIVTLNWFNSNAVWGVKLYVRAGDAERAGEILDDESESVLETDDKCPECLSTEIEYENTWKRWVFLIWSIIGIPLPLIRHEWFCRNCGHFWTGLSGNQGKQIGPIEVRR